MAELGQETVGFSDLVNRAAEESFLSLKELVNKSKSTEISDTDKKISLLKYVSSTQQRMLRLNALAKWCKQVPLINYCQDLRSTLSSHDICFTQAADSLFFMHEGLQQARAPVYDVPSAVEILLTGSYQRLPKCIDDVGMQCSLDEHQQEPALRKLEVLVRSKLLETTLPKEITEVKVSKGTVTLTVDGEFKVLATLGYRGQLSMWRILHLDLLVGERSGPIKLEVTRRHILGDDLERRMSVAENPFTILYTVLHELCVAIVMDTVIRQVRGLLQGRWKDAIRFDLISDTGSTTVNQEGEADSVSLRTPGVKLMYWLDFAGPFIRIEPGSDLQIKCCHSTFVVDPFTGKEAEFSINQNCIDVEKLLLKAICCSRYTRLLEIQKELMRNTRICRGSNDVILQTVLDDPGVEVLKEDSKERVEPEVLRVRAYGSSYFSLGINIRTGRFLLQSSKSILIPSVLEEYEEALNQGSISAVDAFINLRGKSILHCFASIGKFLGLEVYENGLGVNKVPKSLSDGSSVLALRFPDCDSSYLLLMELEKDFTPLFKLVETQSFNDLSNVLRVKKIDIRKIQILEDDLNLIESDAVRLVSSSFSEAEGLNQAPRHHHPRLIDEAPAESSFSSLVDDLFGLQKETSSLIATSYDGPLLRKDQNSRKRSASDLLRLIPSLQGVEGTANPNKRRKTSKSVQSQSSKSLVATSTKTVKCSYSNLIAEANKGNAPSSVFLYALLHVIKYSSLAIKHIKLTSQMEALDIQYVEELGLRDVFSNIWFRLPFAQNDSCKHICLELGKPGSMCWDVKINDQHFRDLCELQKGSKITSWGSKVHIVNSSDVDSHIRYDSEGVVLSYQSVEADSVKKLVDDIQRLSNARMFSLGMRKLLGEGSGATVDRWRAFKIEAVGLTSLWFSFGSGGLARFVIEWESGKDGCFCTMRVSPDQLWPHTKFLEDFVNGADVESLLDCIRLTAGPLHALAAATRPARASTVIGVPATASSSPLGGVAGRSGPGIVPSSLLPIDVSVVLRGPYWIRIIYRKVFAIDMRCFGGDQVWLQPATPPKGGASKGGSLSCPQFRPFIMEHVAQELNGLEPNLNGNQRGNFSTSSAAMNRVGSVRRGPGAAVVPGKVRGELNTAIVGLGDDGGYGGGWVPVVALKKVLRGIVKYLGVLWLFAQLPNLLREILKDNEGSLLNSDSEQPALRFLVRGYVFAVSVHRVQLLLQIHSVKRFHQQQQQQQQQQNGSSSAAQEELTQSEIQELCDYFSRRVTSEPYDASRVGSFITLLTLPISVLREFLKLIAWKKGLSSQSQQASEIASLQRPRIELCLENHSGTSARSNIDFDRINNTVDFALTVVLDSADIPEMNSAGGAGWLPYCVLVRLRYTFGENPNPNPSVTFLGMEGSHGGRSCWLRVDDWEKCRLRVSHTVEVNGSGEVTQGRLKLVADSVQRTLHLCLQGLRDGNNNK